ncbi:MAG TPA: DUF4190 domain-containing protein [Anaerolineales bacterium]|nr:DUF4190 domain-containing protein [Anaerolineales bacterium]
MSNYPGYEQQPSPAYYPPPNSTMAVVSVVAGILGWTFFPILGAIVAVVTGHMAKNEIKASGGRIAGDGLATAGLIFGYLGLALSLIVCIALFFLVLFPVLFGVAAWQSSFIPLVLLPL